MISKAKILTALSIVILLADIAKASADQTLTPRRMAHYTHRQCTIAPDADKPGGSRETAIEIDVLNLTSYPEQIDCKWIKTRGYYVWHENYAFPFPGYLLFNPSQLLFRQAGSELTIENFVERGASNEIDRSIVEFTGFYYELCPSFDAMQEEANAEKKEDETIIVMATGPCHYRNVHVLRDTRMERIVTAGPFYLRSGSNRPAYGNLTRANDSDRNRKRIGEVVSKWVKDVSLGRHHYMSTRADLNSLDEDFRKRFANKEMHIGFLLNSPDSPIRAIKEALNSQQVELFYFSEDELISPAERQASEPDDALACVCRKQDCSNDWPLVYEDRWLLNSPFFCVQVSRDSLRGEDWSVNSP